MVFGGVCVHLFLRPGDQEGFWDRIPIFQSVHRRWGSLSEEQRLEAIIESPSDFDESQKDHFDIGYTHAEQACWDL